MTAISNILREKGINKEMFPEGSDRVNVLLLTMSTLSGHKKVEKFEEKAPLNLSLSNYTYKLRTQIQGQSGSIRFSGYSQLEPLPISLMWRLAARGERLDKIVVINNEDTLEKEKLIQLSNSQEKYESLSAYEFFAKRIAEYDFSNICFEPEKDYRSIKDVDVKEMPELISKTVDFKNPSQGVIDVCMELRNIKKDCETHGKKMKLFLDMHGGLRPQQMLVDSIISVLEHENIYIDETYSVEGDRPNYSIINANESINILKLVSGVSEFVSFGHSNTLMKYLESLEDVDPESQIIIKAINDISNSLQLCRMNEFSDNVLELNEALSNYNGYRLKPIINILRTNFDELLINNDIISQIKWCVKHEFYQQALTIIESLVPAYLFEKRIITYNADKNKKETIEIANRKDFSTQIFCILEKSKVNKVTPFDLFINKNIYKQDWVEIENYIFEKCTDVVNDKAKNGKRRVLLLQPSVSAYIDIPISFYRYDSNKKSCMKIEDINKMKYTSLLKAKGLEDNNQYVWTSNVEIKVSQENSDDFNRFSQIHWLLKQQRNLTNHARPADDEASTDERADVNQIKAAIEAYVSLLEKMSKETV